MVRFGDSRRRMTDSPRRPAWHDLSLSIGVTVFAVTFLSEHFGNLYDIVRMPVVGARLLADHPAAWGPALGAAACLFAAMAVDRRAQPSRRLVGAVEAAVLVYAVVMLHWFLRLGWSGWGAAAIGRRTGPTTDDCRCDTQS